MSIIYKSHAAFLAAQALATIRRYTVGVDLGQTNDPTAIAVIERERVPGGGARGERKVPDKTQYILRHLERLPLNLTYVAQIGYVGSVMARPPISNTEGSRLVIDHTGAGRPVFDMFTHAGLAPVGVTITGGDQVNHATGGYRVPKSLLVSTLQAMLHSGQLEIAGDLPDLTALKGELQNFRVGFTATGHMQFEARSGAHDDLVLAVAIALWYAARPPSGGQIIMPDGEVASIGDVLEGRL